MKYNNEKLSRIYKQRFSMEELRIKEKLWKTLIDKILQNYIKNGDTVMDIGGGECHFINNIRCRKKYVLDLNPDVVKHANKDVITIQKSADDISDISEGSIDVVFVSNFFEHLNNKDQLEKVIAEIKRILKLNGLIIIIQPNIRYAYKEYWDFYDHHIPLSDKSLKELLIINNFKINTYYPKFLPFSTKSVFSKNAFLLDIYLQFPLLWHIFGKQLFIVAQNL